MSVSSGTLCGLYAIYAVLIIPACVDGFILLQIGVLTLETA